jgi:hypothetical protein
LASCPRRCSPHTHEHTPYLSIPCPYRKTVTPRSTRMAWRKRIPTLYLRAKGSWGQWVPDGAWRSSVRWACRPRRCRSRTRGARVRGRYWVRRERREFGHAASPGGYVPAKRVLVERRRRWPDL